MTHRLRPDHDGDVIRSDIPALPDAPLPVRAEVLARHAHAEQLDKQDRPYADFHLAPIAAALSRFGPEAEAAGWLHDIVEDTDIDETDLAELGFPQAVVLAILSVTRDALGPESYSELIERACADPLGALVKLADNACNIAANPGLALWDPKKAESMLRDRYLPARERLLAATGLSMSDVEEMTDVIEARTVAAQTEAAQADPEGEPGKIEG